MECRSVASIVSKAALSQVKWFALEHPKKSEIALIFLNWFKTSSHSLSTNQMRNQTVTSVFSSVGAVYLLGIAIVLLYCVRP